jgi:predicted O-linked N-acetylglucosamine transferase (SPINDLY family)
LGAVIGVVQPFTLAYRTGDHTAVLSRYGTIACRARAAWFTRHPPPERPATPRSSNRLRLLIISGQISNHSVWNVLLHGLLKHLDRTRFEVVLYNTSLKQTSEASLAQTLVDRYHQGEADWLQQTLQDQPDAIFYPEIAMDPIAAQLATLRLAPLQLAGWGHPITTGLPTLDLFCSGELLERSDADHDYSEKLVRLPGTGACSVLPLVAAVPPDTALLHIPADRRITRFLICQQAVKFDPSFDDLYPRIALAATPCRFWFVRDSKNARESSLLESRLNATFAAHGLNPSDYIHFIDWLSGEQLLGLLDIMDIYLDTPAFSGYTTAWQALHRGLPVITLEGRFMRQRLAAGLLRRIGITGTIAADPDEYVLKAAALACAPSLRAELHNCLRKTVPHTDEDLLVVRSFERVINDELARRN